ncbi:MAG TPA: peptide-methionine (R)-S-oxide reductase [Nitrososphaeraceae archaeon]
MHFNYFYEVATYICRKFYAPLFSSESKFAAGCGWPAFDDKVFGALKRLPDPDGMRTEIEFTKCSCHLDREFAGEFLIWMNSRECVNSLSIEYIDDGKDLSRPVNE